jgi:hypothetical protein
MNTDLHALNADHWAKLHFANVNLKDPRRRARALTIATALTHQPGVSIPKLFTRVHEVKAAYTFFDVNEVTPSNLQVGHQRLVAQRIKQPGTYLLIEDSSEFNWSDKTPRAGLGAMHHHHQGFVLHTSLAVQWFKPTPGQFKRSTTPIIGLTHQEFYARIPKPALEADDSKKRKARPRESQLWQRSTQTIGVAPHQADVHWIRVADRGADIEFFLRDCQNNAQGFVVRAAQNRVLVDQHNQTLAVKLFEHSRIQTSLGAFNFALRARVGQAARTAILSYSTAQIRVRGAKQPGGRAEPIACSVVRIWEDQPTPGVEALEWVLLCDTAVQSLDQAFEIGTQYATRWLIEEYHKCLKTGLAADALQLRTSDRLFAAIAVMAVVAVRLLALKEAARVEPDAPAEVSGLEPLELSVLSLVLERALISVKDVALAVGRLGGHMNRPSDGMPGWQSLWAGMQRLRILVEGVSLASQLQTSGV